MSSDQVYSPSTLAEMQNHPIIHGPTVGDPRNKGSKLYPELPVDGNTTDQANGGPSAAGSDSKTQPAVYPGQACRVSVTEPCLSLPPVVPLENEEIPEVRLLNNLSSSSTDNGVDKTENEASYLDNPGAGADNMLYDSNQGVNTGKPDRRHDKNDLEVDQQRNVSGSQASGDSMVSDYGNDGHGDFRNTNQEVSWKGIDSKWATNYDEDFEVACKKYEYFWQKDTVFSQWHWSSFNADGIDFNCAEQFMMYKKAEIFDDNYIGRKILWATAPPKIKSLGRKVHNFDEDVWGANCLHIVKQANIAKFSQNKRMKHTLFDTYPKLLVEASPMDAVWGIGHDKYDERAWDETRWRGRNLLGYILTEVRDELMCDAGRIEKKDKKVYLQKLQDDNIAIQQKKKISTEGTSVDSQQSTSTEKTQESPQSTRTYDSHYSQQRGKKKLNEGTRGESPQYTRTNDAPNSPRGKKKSKEGTRESQKSASPRDVPTSKLGKNKDMTCTRV